jgi:hypothetical protein
MPGHVRRELDAGDGPTPLPCLVDEEARGAADVEQPARAARALEQLEPRPPVQAMVGLLAEVVRVALFVGPAEVRRAVDLR